MQGNPSAPIGHNNPPSDIDIVGENAKRLHGYLFNRAEELMKEAESLPEKVENDIEAGRLGDFVQQVKTSIKNMETLRKSEKEPYLAKSRAVDSFFKRYTEALEKIVSKAAPVADEYKRKKDEEAIRLREEAAAREREAAAEKLREAQRKADEAEALRKEQERIAAAAAAEAERKRKEQEAEAEAARKKHQEEIDRLKKEQEEKEAHLKTIFGDYADREV